MTVLAPAPVRITRAVATRRRSLWLLTIAIVLTALNLRTAVTSVAAVLDEVTNDLGMSGAAAGLLTALPVLSFAGLGALTPALARRTGEPLLLLAALLAMAAGLVARAASPSTLGFLLASTLALTGGAVGNVLIPVVIKRHFPARVGTMTAVYGSALAVGTMLAAAATVPMAHAAGDWRLALGAWAVLATVAVIPWLGLLRLGRVRPSASASAEGSPSGLLRSRLAWSVAIYFGSQSLIAYVMFGWLFQLLRDHGYSAGRSALVVSMFTALTIPTSLIVPSVAARLRDQRVLVVGLASLYVVGFAGMLIGPDGLLWFWACVVSLAMGSFPLALAMFGLRTRSAPATAALSAFGQSTGYLIAGSGPLLVGVVYEATGGWTVPILMLYVAVAAQFISGMYAGGNRFLEDELVSSTSP